MSAAMNKMKVRISLKTPNKTQVEATFRLVVFAVDIVSTVKDRIADALQVPFPDQDLVFGGAALSDDQKIFNCGIKEGSPLDFVVNANDATLVQQLTALMPAGKMSSDELGMMYALKHGVNVTQALQMLGLDSNFKKFLGQSKQLELDAQGQVSLRSQGSQTVAISEPQPKSEEQEDDVPSAGKIERIGRLEKLFACVQDLRTIEKEIEAMSNKLGGCAGLGKLEPIAEVTPKVASSPALPAPWYKKESAKYPGRHYFVNKDTGATSWKESDCWKVARKDSTRVSEKPELLKKGSAPGFQPPPGLEMVVPHPPGLGKPFQAPPGLSAPTGMQPMPRSLPMCLSLINEIPAALSVPKDAPSVISLVASLQGPPGLC